MKKVAGAKTFAPTEKEKEIKRLKAIERMKLKEETQLREEEMKVQRKRVRIAKLSELIPVKI